AIEEGDATRNRIIVRTGLVSPERVFLEVEDTGHGMDAERVEHIFEPFWTSKPKGGGLGLGLSICHGIISSAGGGIRVTRRARGASPGPRRARLLIVDDEPKLGQTLALALSDRFEVEVVDNGRDAQLVLERDGAFDLILCDLMMPEVSGMDLYERVAESRPA